MTSLITRCIDAALDKGQSYATIVAHCADEDCTEEEIMDYITRKAEAEQAAMECDMEE